MKLRNGLLALLVAVMAALCVASVVRPMRFSQQRAERETVVKQRLKAIGEAQERYRKEKGTYCPTLRELVGGGFLADSLRMIPFADGKEFRLQVSAMEKRGGADDHDGVRGSAHRLLDRTRRAGDRTCGATSRGSRGLSRTKNRRP